MRRIRGRALWGPCATAVAAAALLSGCGLSLGGGSSAPPAAAPSQSSTSQQPSPSTTTEPSAEPTTTAPSGTSTAPSPSVTAPIDPAPTTSATPPATPPVQPKPPVKPTPPAPPKPVEGQTLHQGDSGPHVKSVQQRLAALGYWNGTADGVYGHVTSQAVMALQKAAGLGRDGVYGPATRKALEAGIRPKARTSGNGVEIDRARQLLLVVRGGQVVTILNTSTGSGETYTSRGSLRVASTPAGSFSTYRTVNHLDKGPLGDLWRPRYFNGGIAVHGAGSIPGYPASHGCARVSNPAMDMIWSQGLMPVGGRVTVY